MTLIDAYDDRHNDAIRWGNDGPDVAPDIALVEGAVAEEQRMPHAEDEEVADADGVVVGLLEMLAEGRLC